MGVFDVIGLIETLTPDLGAGQEYEYATTLGFSTVGPDGAFVPGHLKLCLEAKGGMNVASFDLGVDNTPGADGGVLQSSGAQRLQHRCERQCPGGELDL